MTLFPQTISWRSPRTIAAGLLLVSLLLVPVIAHAAKETFYITLVARILIFALAASGLNLLLGYAGLVSFGHALFVGLGAYVVGIMADSGLANGWLQLAVTISLCAVVAVVTGAISLRTSGMAFIMITLAFAQMFYFLGISLKQYGGDDGLQIVTRSDLWPLSIRTNTGLYYVAISFLLLTLYVSWRLINSRFGRAIRAAKSNAPRMRVLGYPVFRYQLAIYVLSGIVCGISGFLLANLTNFTSPAYMFWTVSGDLIVMVMLGGIATIVGPLVGAILFVLLETVLAGYTQHWMLYLGPIIVLIALLARRGVYGLIPR
jgi:branched-chain amino acid transport system permease protein